MLLLVRLAMATTALHDDFEDGAMSPWRPVNGQWLEEGGAMHGVQDTAGSGLITLAGYSDLAERVTFTVHPTGDGVGGVIYAASTDGDYCGVWYGHGDAWVGNSTAGEVQVLDGEDPGTDPTLVVTIDEDHLYITVDGVDVYTGVPECGIRRLSGDVGLTALSGSGTVYFADFDFALGGRDRDGDGVDDAEDCAPDDATISPDTPETWYDGIDENCDGRDDYDRDGDGVERDTDCDDTDAFVYPGASDLWYDGKDADCAGNDDYDADGDGHEFDGVGGDDCDDGDADTYPGAPTDEHDGVDHDCDGFIPAPGSDDTGDTAAAVGGDDTGTGDTGGGCGCASGGDPAPAAGLALGLAMVLAGRRRR